MGDDRPGFDKEEIERRRDDAVRRALNTPPQPKQANGKKANREGSGSPEGKAKPSKAKGR